MSLALALLLLAPGNGEGVELSPRRVGDVTATLRVVIGDEAVAPGRGQARYYLNVDGPTGLQVDPPRLEDAFSAWRVALATSSWSSAEPGRVTLTLNLEQMKAGVVPLPGLRLRVRTAPGVAWQDLYWADPLQSVRDVPPVVAMATPATTPWAELAGATLLALLACLAALRLRHWRRGRLRAPTHAEHALARLAVPGLTVEQSTTVVRDFVQSQAGLAPGLTTEELLEAMGVDLVGEAVLQKLRRLLELGDLAKFAGQHGSLAQLTEARQLAQSVVASWTTGPPGETVPSGGGG